jgi:hypothetical protein
MDVESLIKTLRAYDPSFDAAAVRAALSDPTSPDALELRQWAKDHISPDTLLTVDELNQCVSPVYYLCVHTADMLRPYRLDMSPWRTLVWQRGLLPRISPPPVP